MNKRRYLIFYILTLLISSCSDQKVETATHIAQAFESSDECHICGMAITRFAGPKGQAFDKRGEEAKKFCSTMDLVYWYLQPENKHNVTSMFVHDMSLSPWDAPDDSHLIPASTATFVLGSSKKGAMGDTLASFSDPAAANKFATEYGGRVLKLSEIQLQDLNE